MKINDLLNEAGNMPGLVNNPNGGALNWAKNKLGIGMKAKRAKQAKIVSTYSYKKWVDTIGKMQANGQFQKTGNEQADFNAYMDQLESFTRKQFGLRNKAALARFKNIAGNGGNPNKDSITRAFLQAFTDTDLQNAVSNKKSQKQKSQQPLPQQPQQSAPNNQAQSDTGTNAGIQNGSTVSYGGKTYKWVNNAWRASDGETLTGTDAEAATYTFRNPE